MSDADRIAALRVAIIAKRQHSVAVGLAAADGVPGAAELDAVLMKELLQLENALREIDPDAVNIPGIQPDPKLLEPPRTWLKPPSSPD